MGRHHREDRRRQAEGGLCRLGVQVRRLSEECRLTRYRHGLPGGLRGQAVRHYSMASTASASARSGRRFRGRSPTGSSSIWLIAPAIFLLLLIGLFPLIYSLVVSFQRITMMDDGHLLRRALQLRAAVHGHAALAVARCTRLLITVIALPLELVLGLAHGLALPRTHAGPADLRVAAGAADRHLADRRRRHLAAAVRQPLRPDQPDPRLVRRRAASTALWTVNPNLVYPAIILCEIWQWTPFMFLILLAALVQCRQVADGGGGDRRGRLLAHLPQDRAAGDLAGDGHRHPDPRPRSRAHLRHHLGADRRAAPAR